MTYEVIVQKEAILDILDAVEWYEDKRVGLGNEFALEVDICINRISNNPKNYSFINKNYRRLKTNRFPYLIIYEIEQGTVVINSVLHAKRRGRYNK
jgi:plasmid stabilization system protein ParE